MAGVEGTESRPSNDKSLLLLALYRYEAMAKLSPSAGSPGYKDLEDLLSEIVKMPEADAKTFETVAGWSARSSYEWCRVLISPMHVFSVKELSVDRRSATKHFSVLAHDRDKYTGH